MWKSNQSHNHYIYVYCSNQVRGPHCIVPIISVMCNWPKPMDTKTPNTSVTVWYALLSQTRWTDRVLSYHAQTETAAHYGNFLMSLSWSKQPKDTTTPTSNRPSTFCGGQLWTGRWFCWANLFTGTSLDKVTTSRDSTIPSLEFLQIRWMLVIRYSFGS